MLLCDRQSITTYQAQASPLPARPLHFTRTRVRVPHKHNPEVASASPKRKVSRTGTIQIARGYVMSVGHLSGWTLEKFQHRRHQLHETWREQHHHRHGSRYLGGNTLQ